MPSIARQRFFAYTALGALLGLLYAVTLAPGLTWANNGADGGDLLTAAFTGGVAHPPGYPLYLALISLPLGDPALRANLFSAICAWLAGLLFLRFLRHALAGLPGGHLAAWLAALAFSVTPLFWGQAVITEVYTLNVLLIVALLNVLFDERLPGADWTPGLIFGLAVAHHLTTLLLLPLLLLPPPGRPFPPTLRQLFFRFLALFPGLALYLTLLLRAAGDSPVNWGHPDTLPALWWLVSGQLYSSYAFGMSADGFLLRLRILGTLLAEQFGLLGLALGFYGVLTGRPRILLLVGGWMFVTFGLFSLGYASYDAQLHLIPACLGFACWLAVGMQQAIEHYPRLQRVMIGLLGLLLLGQIALAYRQVDASKDTRALDFISMVSSQAPDGAVILTDGDRAIFALQYARFVQGRRSDLLILSRKLLGFGWYRANLRDTYPQLQIPEQGPWTAETLAKANPQHPVCTVHAEGDGLLHCP